tara:strand:- start:1163 stop:1864 length:702 start_codon:yes stop_codon:yes gene_type:complete
MYKKYLSFNVYKKNCRRLDRTRNDKLHFFSSLIAVRVSFILYKLGFNPDLVTLLFGIFGVSAACMFFYGFPLFAYLLWRIHIILDMADGNLARATKRFNDYAKITDKFTHIIVNLMVFSALFLSSEYVLTSRNNLKLFITLLSIYSIYFLFDIISASTGFNSFIRAPSNLIAVTIKNICTQEGLLFFVTTILFLEKRNLINSDSYYSILLIFYNFTYLLAVLIKIYSLKIKKV